MFKNLKKYKIILIDEKSLGVKEISSKSLFYSILGIAFCLFIFLFVSFYSTDINNFLSLKSILWHKSKNVELQNLVKEQDEKIDILIDQIDSLSKRDENLRKIIKLPPIDNDIRKLGVGGAKKTNKIINDINYLLPDDIEYDFLDRINFIKRSVNLENLSYSEIEEYTNTKLEELLHYPGIYPISRKNSRFTSGYGYRIDPFSKKRKHHKGDDFSAKIGTDVIATANGIVKTSKRSYVSGNYIQIDHGNGYVTTYGHLSERLVKKGDKIHRGDIIGKVGNTGKSTAPHLHYEISFNDKHINPRGIYYDLSLNDKK